MSTSNKYVIQSENDYDWEVGHTGRDEQVLIGVYDSSVVAVFFDGSGNLQRFECRPSSLTAQVDQRSTDDSSDDASLESLLAAWKAEIGFVRSEIQVSRFFIPEPLVGIKDLPAFLQSFLNNPESITSTQERQEWYLDVHQWSAQAKFVFCWGKEYWMSSKGEVTDT